MINREQRAYDEGRWCGECEYSEVADPPCCLAYNTAALTPVPGRDGLTRWVLSEVAHERLRQTAKHGDQSNLPNGTGPGVVVELANYQVPAHYLAEKVKARCKAASQSEGDGSVTFEHILTEEWAEALSESDPVKLRTELIQVAATAVQWVEAIDLRAALDAAPGLDSDA